MAQRWAVAFSSRKRLRFVETMESDVNDDGVRTGVGMPVVMNVSCVIVHTVGFTDRKDANNTAIVCG